jgi:hypothetical protein
VFIPRYWSRAVEGSRATLGWSDASTAEAEKLARARLAKLSVPGGGEALPDWDYYPSTPVKEEILETPRVAGCAALITRNRAGAQVLNTDRVAFIDIDLHARSSLLGSIGALFGRKRDAPDAGEVAALARAQAWAEINGARLRAYRTAGGLRLIRMDRTLDPSGEECARMFADLGADPQYSRLCRIQKSYRARLTPKPRRIGCSSAPGGHPRTDSEIVRAFAIWVQDYEHASRGHSVCSLVKELGTGTVVAEARAVAELHDRCTLRDGEKLA